MFHMGEVYFLRAVINATMSTTLCRYLKLDTWVGANSFTGDLNIW